MSLLRNAVTKVGVSKALRLVGNCLNAAAQRSINNELLLISTKGIDDVQETLAVYLRGAVLRQADHNKHPCLSAFICGLKTSVYSVLSVAK